MKYEVLEKEGFSGLTLGSHVLRPGAIFDEERWPYSKESLMAAEENKRCRKLEEKKSSPVSEEPAKKKKADS